MFIELNGGVYRSLATSLEYNIHPTLDRAGALEALVDRRDTLRFMGHPAIIEGYMPDQGSSRAPIEAIALRFAGVADIALTYGPGMHFRVPLPRFSSAGIGIAVTGDERLTLLSIVKEEWQRLLDDVLFGHPNKGLADSLLSALPVIRSSEAPNPLPTLDAVKEMLRLYSDPSAQAPDHRFSYTHSIDKASPVRPASGELPGTHLVLATMIE